MKRVFCLILAAVLLCGMAGVSASAEGTLTVAMSDATAKPGEVVEVILSLENNPGIKYMSIFVSYDKTVLTPYTTEDQPSCVTPLYTDPDPRNPSVLQQDPDGIYFVSEDANRAGYWISWVRADAFTGSQMFSFKFQVAENAQPGSTKISFWMDPDTEWGDSIIDATSTKITDIAFSDGTVTIKEDAPYYLMGTLNNWTASEEYQFVANPNAQGEYMLNTTLPVGAEIKVAHVTDGNADGWYPDNAGNYTVDAAHSGDVTVYFRPNGNNDWNSFHTGGFFFIQAHPSMTIYGSSASMKGNVGLNFYVIPSASLLADENAYVTLNGTRYMLKDAPTREEGDDLLYQFSTTLFAKQMDLDVTLKAFTGNNAEVKLIKLSDNTDVTETGYILSVQGYIQKVLGTNPDEKTVALMNAMSDYGKLAKAHFEGGTAETVNDLSAVTADTVAPFAQVVTTGKATGVTYTGKNLVLESETTLQLFFSLDEGKIGDYTFKVGTKVVTPVETENGWMISIPNISAKNLHKTYAVKVTSTAGTVVTVKCSALSYVYTVLSEGGYEDSLVNLVKGIYLYNRAAKAYFG